MANEDQPNRARQLRDAIASKLREKADHALLEPHHHVALVDPPLRAGEVGVEELPDHDGRAF
ncbi:MAG: hypothetical protein HUU25_13810, partial [Candidatus Sumerlaeia bacterium]|nr:hypothetical protein [Candidatus Sumerlaeia bacterium]